ncbi:hypothetical protein PA08_2591 [Cutibacterium modestum P08]|nr:hypothetical protein PA08_2591 [Cutibacterium modestum P08]
MTVTVSAHATGPVRPGKVLKRVEPQSEDLPMKIHSTQARVMAFGWKPLRGAHL